MKDKLIMFETAKLAKEKGFDILSHSYYFEDGEFKENSLTGTNGYYGENYEFNLEEFNENWNDKWLTKKSGDRCFGCSKDRGYFETFSAPTQSLLQKWLREVHNIHINITRIYNFNKKPAIFQGYSIYISGKSSEDITYGEINNKLIRKYYSNYEEALEVGLQETLKLIK